MSLSSASTLVKPNKTGFLKTHFTPWAGKPHLDEVHIKPINSVGQILSSIHNLPKTAVLLGKCHDGLPIFLDLFESSIGSVLVLSDEGYGKTHQLQVIVQSGIIQSADDDIRIAVISKNPWEWEKSFFNRLNKLSLGCHAWHGGGAERLISNVFDECDDRLNGSINTIRILFILDDYEEITNLDQDSQIALEWLLDNGPKVNIWPIASISSTSIVTQQISANSFKTHIIGKFGKGKSYLEENQIFTDTSNFDPGEFTVLINSFWMTYRLPMLGM